MTVDRSTFHSERRRWALPTALALLAVSAELGGDAARALLRYERIAVLDGEWWRVITGNLAHLGPRHLVLNLVGLALVAALDDRALRGRHGLVVATASMAGVGLGLLAFAPGIGWYVGLSGMLHGLLAALAVEQALDPAARRWGLALGGALAAKLAWEQLAGPVPLTAEAAGGPVVVVAHLHGALAGALVALGLAWWGRGRARSGAQV